MGLRIRGFGADSTCKSVSYCISHSLKSFINSVRVVADPIQESMLDLPEVI
jgi:hypothetical protein